MCLDVYIGLQCVLDDHIWSYMTPYDDPKMTSKITCWLTGEHHEDDPPDPKTPRIWIEQVEGSSLVPLDRELGDGAAPTGPSK